MLLFRYPGWEGRGGFEDRGHDEEGHPQGSGITVGTSFWQEKHFYQRSWDVRGKRAYGDHLLSLAPGELGSWGGGNPRTAGNRPLRLFPTSRPQDQAWPPVPSLQAV